MSNNAVWTALETSFSSVTCQSTLGHFQAFLCCLHRLMKHTGGFGFITLSFTCWKIWFHSYLFWPSPSQEAWKWYVKCRLLFTFQSGIINHHSWVNSAVTDGTVWLFSAGLKFQFFHLYIRMQLQTKSFFCGVLLDNYFLGKTPEDSLFNRQYV